MAKWVLLMALTTPRRLQYSLNSRIVLSIRAPRGQLISLHNLTFTATMKSLTIRDTGAFSNSERFAHMKQRGSLGKFEQHHSYSHEDENGFPIRGVLSTHVKGQYIRQLPHTVLGHVEILYPAGIIVLSHQELGKPRSASGFNQEAQFVPKERPCLCQSKVVENRGNNKIHVNEGIMIFNRGMLNNIVIST